MPHYHFHIHNSVGFIEDEEGRDLPDLETVRSEGLKGVRSILSEEVLEGKLDLRGRLDVVSENGEPVLTIRFTEAIEMYAD